MNIEIVGIGAPNKGAELMLTAAMEQINARYSDVKFVLEPYTDYKYRSKHGCYQKSWFTFKGIQVGNFLGLLPKGIRNRFGIVLDSEIDVILDASGFAYGDQWGAPKARNRLAKYIAKWKASGKKVIMLPQALGPFENTALKQEMSTIFQHCDIAFARDNMSFEFATSVGTGNVKQSPDFTNLCKGILPRDLSDTPLDICVIPNAKMIEMTTDEVGSTYVSSLVEGIEVALAEGREPFLLVHEGKGDLNIAQEINEQLTQALPIYQYDDPKEIKGVIGHSKLVISSRFHGLVSSLSQGVPCVATGWSHKYQMLMDDYECGKYLAGEGESVSSLVAHLLEQSEYDNTQEKIVKNAELQKQLTKKMWDQVFDIIGK